MPYLSTVGQDEVVERHEGQRRREHAADEQVHHEQDEVLAVSNNTNNTNNTNNNINNKQIRHSEHGAGKHPMTVSLTRCDG